MRKYIFSMVLIAFLSISFPAVSFAEDSLSADGQSFLSGASKEIYEQDGSVEKWKRLSAGTALNTMSIVHVEGFPDNSCNSAILASVDGYWDALTAAGLAGLKGCPVIMVDRDGMSWQNAGTITRIGANKVYIVGGTSSVSSVVETQAASLPGVESVERISGPDAQGTALAIYEKAQNENMNWGNVAIVATASTFHDALAASPLSYAKSAPIFLTNSANELSDSAIEAIATGGFEKVLICGGTFSVSPNVENQLSNIACIRLAGQTSHETSAVVAEQGISMGMVANKMGVVTSSTYHDALSASSLCGKNNSILILVSDSNTSAIDSFVVPHKHEIATGYIIGGTLSVSESIQQTLEEITAMP